MRVIDVLRWHAFFVMWFEDLMGFREESPQQVRENCYVENGVLFSKVNGRQYHIGDLEIPDLGELRRRTKNIPATGNIKVDEIVGDVTRLHCHKENEGAIFQVASQFNLLEMVNPAVTPEMGVGEYQYDATQGPACAIACGAGTIYRNYFVPVGDQPGQSAENQIDCLDGVGKVLGKHWQMRNGYALPTLEGLQQLSDRLKNSTETELDSVREALRVGIHWSTEVTVSESHQQVAQVYGSALPVSYSGLSSRLWEPFARVVLEASYEAMMLAAVINQQNTGNPKVFLTLLGGGAFGNDSDWIFSAIRRALKKVEKYNLEVKMVSYGSSRAEVVNLAAEF